MGEIYRKNLNLQKKLDEIKMRGTGISFWGEGRGTKTSKSPRRRFSSRLRGPNEQGILHVKHNVNNESLNFHYQRKEAQRIDVENV